MPSSDPSLPVDLQREIRAGRKFTLGEAIGREGGSFLKGSQAMVPRPLRSLAAINRLIDQNLNDRDGALQLCLREWIKADGRVDKYLDNPPMALQVIVIELVQQPQVLYEFSRQVAVKWGQINGERPYFQKPGTDAHPDAVYSHEIIQKILTGLLTKLSTAQIEPTLG